MKPTIICSLVIAAAVGLTPIARAQETETPTSGSTPNPSETESSSSSEAAQETTTESTSKSYPVPGTGTTTSPTIAPKSSPTVSASASTKAAASPAAAATKQARTSAAPVVLKGTPEQQIRQIEDAYETATQAHNVSLIEPFIADDAVVTGSKNRVMNRRAVIAEFKKDTDTYTTAKNTELKFHKVDNDVYVVTGVAREAGKDKTGKAFDRRYRFTDTLVNRNGKWLVVASHVSTLSGR